jgi:hypothetical protein
MPFSDIAYAHDNAYCRARALSLSPSLSSKEVFSTNPYQRILRAYSRILETKRSSTSCSLPLTMDKRASLSSVAPRMSTWSAVVGPPDQAERNDIKVTLLSTGTKNNQIAPREACAPLGSKAAGSCLSSWVMTGIFAGL